MSGTSAGVQPMNRSGGATLSSDATRATPIDEVDELRAEIQHLRTALLSRAVIDQAKGVLMARYGMSDDDAFTVLTRWSQDQNVKVRVLAAALVAEASQGEHATQPPHLPTTRDGPPRARDPRAGIR